MGGVRGLVLVVRFLVELGMLASLAWWGFETFDGAAAFAVGVAAPLAAAVVWGAFVAPKARWSVAVPVRVAIELVLFALATLALVTVGAYALAGVFGALAVATSILNATTEPGLASPSTSCTTTWRRWS